MLAQDFAPPGSLAPSGGPIDVAGDVFSGGGQPGNAPIGGDFNLGGTSFAQAAQTEGGALSGLFGGLAGGGGQQYAAAPAATQIDMPATGGFSLSARDIAEREAPIGGPGSQLYAAATGEGTQLPGPGEQAAERTEKETAVPGAIALPTVTVSSQEETPVVGGGTTTAQAPGGEPPVEGGAPTEPTISPDTAPEAMPAGSTTPAPGETAKELATRT